ncbi:hypothetical protein [Phormidium nigroviride]
MDRYAASDRCHSFLDAESLCSTKIITETGKVASLSDAGKTLILIM